VQQDGDPLFGRDAALEAGHQGARHARRLEGLAGIVGFVGCLVQRVSLGADDPGGLPLPGAQCVEGPELGDAEEPGAQRRVADEPRHALVRLDEHLLPKVFGEGGVSDDAQAEGVDRVAVGLHQEFEGGPALTALD
jgi:hypothetical protein